MASEIDTTQHQYTVDDCRQISEDNSNCITSSQTVDSYVEDKNCPICLEEFNNDKPAIRLGQLCKHTFCQICLDETMKRTPSCPVCKQMYGEMTGNQPDGEMNVTLKKFPSLPGYEGCGTIVIDYIFPDGIQGPNHPNPGKRYAGTWRTAYLPNNAEGQKVASLLRKAFDARLIFTVGTSVTTGAKSAVTWNDIHHKTSMKGGAEYFGYPDTNYLRRVTDELAAKGIK